MGDLPISLVGLISIIVGMFLIKMVTGIIIRIIVLILLAAFLFYLYKMGAHEIIMAPGAPGSEIIGETI